MKVIRPLLLFLTLISGSATVFGDTLRVTGVLLDTNGRLASGYVVKLIIGTPRGIQASSDTTVKGIFEITKQDVDPDTIEFWQIICSPSGKVAQEKVSFSRDERTANSWSARVSLQLTSLRQRTYSRTTAVAAISQYTTVQTLRAQSGEISEAEANLLASQETAQILRHTELGDDPNNDLLQIYEEVVKISDKSAAATLAVMEKNYFLGVRDDPAYRNYSPGLDLLPSDTSAQGIGPAYPEIQPIYMKPRSRTTLGIAPEGRTPFNPLNGGVYSVYDPRLFGLGPERSVPFNSIYGISALGISPQGRTPLYPLNGGAYVAYDPELIRAFLNTRMLSDPPQISTHTFSSSPQSNSLVYFGLPFGNFVDVDAANWSVPQIAGDPVSPLPDMRSPFGAPGLFYNYRNSPSIERLNTLFDLPSSSIRAPIKASSVEFGYLKQSFTVQPKFAHRWNSALCNIQLCAVTRDGRVIVLKNDSTWFYLDK